MTIPHWLLTAPAILEYLTLQGRLLDDASVYDHAEAELSEIVGRANFVRTEESGRELWRVTFPFDRHRGRMGQIDLYVMPRHGSYDRPQLVRVRLKRRPR